MPGFGEMPAPDSHFNTDGLLNVNSYADVDRNPYVVGSAAYNAAHGLPAPRPWEERTSLPDGPAGTPLQPAAGTAAANVPSGSVDLAASNLPWLLLIGLAAFLIVKG